MFQINGQDCSKASHNEAVSLLTSSTGDVTLVVYRENLIPSSPITAASAPSSTSAPPPSYNHAVAMPGPPNNKPPLAVKPTVGKTQTQSSTSTSVFRTPAVTNTTISSSVTSNTTSGNGSTQPMSFVEQFNALAHRQSQQQSSSSSSNNSNALTGNSIQRTAVTTTTTTEPIQPSSTQTVTSSATTVGAVTAGDRYPVEVQPANTVAS